MSRVRTVPMAATKKTGVRAKAAAKSGATAKAVGRTGPAVDSGRPARSEDRRSRAAKARGGARAHSPRAAGQGTPTTWTANLEGPNGQLFADPTPSQDET